MSGSPRLELAGNRLRLSGDIDPDNVIDIRNQGERLIAGENQNIVIDLRDLGAAHSVVLSLLLCWIRLARSLNKDLSLEGVGDRLRSLAALSGLEDHLPEPDRSPADHSPS